MALLWALNLLACVATLTCGQVWSFSGSLGGFAFPFRLSRIQRVFVAFIGASLIVLLLLMLQAYIEGEVHQRSIAQFHGGTLIGYDMPELGFTLLGSTVAALAGFVLGGLVFKLFGLHDTTPGIQLTAIGIANLIVVFPLLFFVQFLSKMGNAVF